MNTLREAYRNAQTEGVALGHFNISDSTQLTGIAQAAQALDLPVVIGVSDGEGGFLGISQTRALVDAARDAYGIPIFLNRDHAHTVDDCKAAIDAGFDSVIFDGVKLALEDNIEKTKEVVAYARASGRDVLVEAELGYIGTSSALLDDVPDDVVFDSLPSDEDAANFVAATGIDALAPAVGNLHGMLKGRSNPALNIDLISKMRSALPETALVLHGGSGITDEDFKAAISAGMNCVHINTEIRVAYRKGIENGLAADAEQVAPYKYLNYGRDAVAEVVTNRLRLFSNQ